MGQDVRSTLDRHGVRYRDESDLSRVLPEVDVVYQTRVQRERFATPEEYTAARGIYIITPESLELMRPQAVILHPLPRVDEIAPEVDADPRAAYFRQAHGGVLVRMALLEQLLHEQNR
jgi:aspartate carbamoyltransferase catalytic subunit